MKLKKSSKSERLIYIVIILWIFMGVLGLIYNTDLVNLSGYYTSLTLFVSTYLWGEYKRTSTSTSIISKGHTSSREIVIYVAVLLWIILGIFGIIKNIDINTLTVYFSSLSPFVISYIIYKTSKGNDLPIFKTDTNKNIKQDIENIEDI
ncbi:MAG: hypothetical protein WDA02_10940 [Saccharofermentanales bacterium]